MPKVVFSPPLPGVIMESAKAMVPVGFDLEIIEEDDPQFLAKMADADYFIGFARDQLNAEFFRAAPRLKLVQLISAGYDRADVEAARQARVPISNNGGANSVAVSEHTLLLILAVYRQLAWQHNNVINSQWRVGDFAERRFYELAGKTVGVVGLGTIGKRVVRRLKGFDVRIQYYDTVRMTEEQEDAMGVKFVLLPELLRTSDVVTLHVPLNDRTRNMISTRELATMKDDAILINTCRGPVVDEEALHTALTSRQIGAAGLDVMTQEPPQANHPLFGLENVIITPHTAGPTWENWPKAFRNAFDNVTRVDAGDQPMWVIPELRQPSL